VAAEAAKRSEERAKALRGTIERYLAAEDVKVKLQARAAAGSPLGPKELADAEAREENRAKQLGEAMRQFREGDGRRL
jgi:hypothetical protein